MLSRHGAGRDQGAMPWAPQGGLIRRTIDTGARLLGVRPSPPSPGAAPPPTLPATEPEPPVAPSAPPLRACHRRAWADRLWGEGMALPGGAPEVLRLAALLPLSPESTLLLAGNGAAAAGDVVAGGRGCFVAAFEPGAPAGARPARRRVTTEPLDPAAPGFRARFHHHALLLEPLRAGISPDGLLAATAAGLRPGGQLVLMDLVARGMPAGAAEARWLAAEGRPEPPAEVALPAALQRAGFDIHVVEDLGRRHRDAVLSSWQALMVALRDEPTRPAAPEAADLVAEAEAWLLRLRLMQEGRLRLLRWHASMTR
ncbi:hypothetical protein [Roseomonas fluvialis]|uniref:Class I SAM-dependent methyltransferase n=1 Tax=Roseomonas fluvialis TaxID=1750527 RepID=A0ABN6NXP3_9PROT|nr:hypothetical protein [Roseomonas fluvialis]BDG70815.1 hypothetical protein Rmf_07440 [Roseomonas fluvialis]